MKGIGKVLTYIAIFSGLGIAFMFVASFTMLVSLMHESMQERTAEKVTSDKAVTVLELEGDIFESNDFLEELREAAEDEAVKGIVVKIDSPGGAVGTSEAIYQGIKRYAASKPVVCSLGNMAASGGLYVAMGCSKVVTYEGTITGSIGVILMMPNFTEAMKDLGVDVTTVKSGKFKDAGSPVRPVTEEDRAVLQNVVDTAHSQFVARIVAARGLTEEQVREFADGRVILGATAVELGLADAIGDEVTAAKLALEVAGIEGEPELVYPDEPDGFMKVLKSFGEAQVIQWVSTLWRGPVLYYGDLAIR